MNAVELTSSTALDSSDVETAPVVSDTATNRGLSALQGAETMPASSVPPQVPVPTPKRTRKPEIVPGETGDLQLNAGWELVEEPTLKLAGHQLSGAVLSSSGIDTTKWFDATVPGTVLTTLIEQGVYPDPYYGLNNLAIPEVLNQQSYWYRIAFKMPEAYRGKHITLRFNGINYHAEVWMNSSHCGQVTGAFKRGIFDVTRAAKIGEENVVAVRVTPPPHPGLPHEKSLAAGVGPNGGAMCQDGPTFIATEGWDWVPAMRDRCTGIWQDVVVHATDAVSIRDPQVVTELPLPDTSYANVTVRTEICNLSPVMQEGVLCGEIEGLHFAEHVALQPHQSRTVVFDAMRLESPRLWWPNGYGTPELTDLHLRFELDGHTSDEAQVRFGVRQFDYEFAPHLTLLVNGQKVMCKGGNWGMDDALKRVSRERLEPYIRMHRDANFTMIRNWTGESTEEDFYALCDEYGILVWNDFWMSTGGYNLEPTNVELFLDNARDTITRFRNHACLAVWCGRNEGVPPKALNDGLAELVDELDGTRYYQCNSRDIDLMNSGPWNYRPPVEYFVDHARGFTTELGMPCVPTLEAMQAMMPEADLWPHSDTWAYHDMHRDSNWATYLEALDRIYGGARGIREFCRKAQMLNYVNHRAMFEAWNAKLFDPCSGVLLWMSHPAWPSMVWQLYSSDYEPTAALYGAQKGCEPIHIQMNLPDGDVAIINNTAKSLAELTVSAQIFDIRSQRVWNKEAKASARANACSVAFALEFPAEVGVCFVKLELTSPDGKLISQNFYWHSPRETNYVQLNAMPRPALTVMAHRQQNQEAVKFEVVLQNASPHIALMTQMSLRDGATNERILPTFYSDNYISLVPGETRTVMVECATSLVRGALTLQCEGFNVDAFSVTC